jgi:hypothetical protein
MMLFVFLLIVFPLSINGLYESSMTLTSMGFEYQPKNNIQLIATKTIQTKILCSMGDSRISPIRFSPIRLSPMAKVLRYIGESTVDSRQLVKVMRVYWRKCS